MRIVKENSSGVWVHKDDENSKIDLILSNGWCKIDGDVFELYGASSGEVRTALLSDIIVEDASSGGGDETFSNSIDLFSRLKELEYPCIEKAAINNALNTNNFVRFTLNGAWGTLLADVDKSSSLTPSVLEVGDRFSGWIPNSRYVVGVIVSLPFNLDDETSVQLVVDNEI